ncbi:MAG: hypothetical protein IPL21_11360 [Saprospirales bacterium]|nr:hypothetical protein [Saprospirales bacterium]
MSNPTYSNDPGYTDTSAYPCTDILQLRMKGFETDQTNPFGGGAACDATNDGACGGTCANPSCYGVQQTPTSGDNNVLINIGDITNYSTHFVVLLGQQLFKPILETVICTTNGINNYYYLRGRYRWCWDSSTVLTTHVGLIKRLSVTEICSASNYFVADSSEAYEAARGFRHINGNIVLMEVVL